MPCDIRRSLLGVGRVRRRVTIVLICEDQQHEVFARRFLEKVGVGRRQIRVVRVPRGRGSAEQFVREQFPCELVTYRTNRRRVAQALVVMIDGNGMEWKKRIDQLRDSCHQKRVPWPDEQDKVLIAVPTWSIETQFAYLDVKDVTETTPYPRLSKPRLCQRYVDKLWEACTAGWVDRPLPPSLAAACEAFIKESWRELTRR